MERSYQEDYWQTDIFNEVAKNLSFKQVMALDCVSKDFHKKVDFYLSLQFEQKNKDFFFGKSIKGDFKKFLALDKDFLDEEYPHTYLSYQMYKFYSNHSLGYQNAIVDYTFCSSIENRDDFHGKKIFLSTQRYFDTFKKLDCRAHGRRLVFLEKNLVTEENIRFLIEEKGISLKNIHCKDRNRFEFVKDLFFKERYFAKEYPLSFDFLKYLITRGRCNPNTRSRNGELLLYNLVESNNLEMVRFLLGKEARIFSPKSTSAHSSDNKILDKAIQNKNIEMFNVLYSKALENNFDIVTNAAYKSTLLLEAVSCNCIEIINFLLNNGANVRFNERELLYEAVKNNNKETVRLLHDNGVDVNSEFTTSNNDILFPLFVAADKNYVDMIKLLISLGAKTEVYSKGWYRVRYKYGGDSAGAQGENITPLCKAIMKGNSKIVALLIENGANVKSFFRDMEENEYSCLDVALGIRNIEIITMLLNADATVSFMPLFKKKFFLVLERVSLLGYLFLEPLRVDGDGFFGLWYEYKKDVKIHDALERTYIKQNYPSIVTFIGTVFLLKYLYGKIDFKDLIGKGNDTYQEVAGKKMFFSDEQEVRVLV